MLWFDRNSTFTPPQTPNQVIFMWISVIIGTLIGGFAGFVAGPSKIVEGHPMNKAMAYGFEYVYGPFIGYSGTQLRMMIGYGEVVSGIGIIAGVWIDAFGIGP